jgi:hypothetical protein
MIDRDRYSAELQFYIEHYRLGPPLLSVQIEASRVTLLQQQPGTMWCVEIDEHGGGASGGSEFGWIAISQQRVMYGVLPDGATQIEVILPRTDKVSTHITNGVFLVVAPLEEDTNLRFKDNAGTIVEQRVVPASHPRNMTVFARLRRWWQWRFAYFYARRSTVSYGAPKKRRSG